MKRNSSSGGGGGGVVPSQTTIIECCMCGDYGFSYELFRCKLCHFRSQHRYCSNEYPKAESYKLCNWCLALKNESSNSNISNSTNSSSSSKTKNNKDAKRITPQKGVLRLQFEGRPRSLAEIICSPTGSKKRNLGVGATVEEERIIRTRSEELTNNTNKSGRQHLFRNKARSRRYKLLDEVST